MTQERMHEKIDKIDKIDKLDVKKPTTVDIDSLENAQEIAPNKEKFTEALNRAERKWDEKVVSVQQDPASLKASPISEMQSTSPKIALSEPPTLTEVIDKARETKEALQNTKKSVEEQTTVIPDNMMSRETRTILSDYLTHINSTLERATKNVGVEASIQEIEGTTKNPLTHFLNFLSHGDKQLNTLISELQALDFKGGKIAPEKLFAVQIKLGFVQQELEFFTNVLNKSLESIKTLMNTQI